MWLDVFNANPYGTNCWLLAAEGSDDAVVVDPGFEPAARARAARRPPASARSRSWPPTRTSTTRRPPATSRATLPVFVHEADAVGVHRRASPGDAGVRQPARPRSKDLRTVADGDVLRFAGFSLEVLHTPGHTPGHCCFRVDGDALFSPATWCSRARSGGRTSRTPIPSAMQASLRRFLTLPDDLPVLPGHGPDTTVGPRARHEPVPAGTGLMDLAPPRGTQDLLPPRVGRDARPVRAGPPDRRASSASATSRRRRSSTPSCSRAPRGDTSATS